jgi:glycosyltransferase involved in cell wall biosynthesis
MSLDKNRKLSVAIPTHNRECLLYESFSEVINDPRVSEIIIVDDRSENDIYARVHRELSKIEKVRLIRNSVNVDCYKNKMRAVSYCNNKFCILLDSDNIIDTKYIDTIFDYQWEEDVILAPVFAKPQFDYRAYQGQMITQKNVASLMDLPMFSTALNTANYFVHRDSYVQVFDFNVDPVTADSIFMAYQWLSSGRKIYFTPGLHYYHRVHGGSHYINNVHRTGNFLSEVEQKLKLLK